ncbi:MAG: hypothetical protein Q9162_004755 [Coniocarpon cinnabarinum]
MPLMRNPFRKAPTDLITDSSGRPLDTSPIPPPSGSAGRPASIEVPKTQPAEYKMSEINDSGVFLPPSPPATDKPRFWTARSTTSTSSSSHRSVFSEDNNPFTISRESFDSYRRSFDISARSPIVDQESARTRQSLDAARLRLPPPRLRDSHINTPETQPEERFEDVGLGDDVTKPKRQGLLSRLGGHNAQDSSPADTARPSSSHFGSQLFTRKRAQSGSAQASAELSSMVDRPEASKS